MIDKLSKKVLKHLQKESNYSCDYFFSFYEDFEAMAKKLSVNEEDLRAAIRFLVSEEYVNYIYCGDNPANFQLDHKGAHKWEFDLIKVKKFFIRSIITPIIVSFFTAALTANLWPEIWLWLQGFLKLSQ